jgi:amino acid adenylation domain-containing protein
MNVFEDTPYHLLEYSEIDSATDVPVFPASFSQQRLWLLDRLTGTTANYNIPAAFRLQGKLDAEALEAALNAMIRRHEILRTCFAEQQGAPVQVIHPSLSLPLATVDLRQFPEAQRAAEVARRLQAHKTIAFNLQKLPLLHAQLLRLGEEDYLFLLTFDHIIFDGWSMVVFARELSALYEAFSQGLPPSLPELPIQYADYAVWQRETLQGETLEGLLDYWTARLAEAPTLELPTDRPRPAVPSFRGEIQHFSVSPDLATGLKALSRQANVTLFMTLAAAFQVLLQRYSGQDDIVIGTPIAGRSRLELEGLIGFFVNTLVLRADLSGNPRFCELLAQVRDVTLGAYAHQDLPFDKLVEALNLQRDRSRHPLFQVMFALQDTPDEKLQLNEVALESLPADAGMTLFDLSLELSETPQGLTGRLEYSTDLFEAATISRLIGHSQTLLEGIVANPEARLSELPLLTEPERHQLLVEWNDTTAAFPRDQCIHDLFEAQVASTPQAVAVVYEDSQLTYGELNAQANRLAHHLRELGVKPDARVALCVERGLNMMVGLLAILKAGGAYVPLDPAYPKERLAFMLEDSAPVAVLTQGRLENLFADGVKALPVIDLDADFDLWARKPETNPDHSNAELTAENLAYVIYTSGSTGQPKGITMPHRVLVNLITWQMNNARVACTARTLQYSPISFDVSFQELFSTWCGGGTLVLIDEPTRLDPWMLLQCLDQNRIERLFLPFIALEQLARYATLNGHFPGNLREVITAGEQLRITPEIDSFFTSLPDCRLVNQYGPSETHVVTAFELPAKCADWGALPPIGRPIANTQIYILDNHGEPVPIGVTGELYIGGACVARGYLSRPKLTNERFLADPFVEEPSARMYKTGDLGRWLANGTIEFFARNDFQVKIRGFRIELGEIEAALCRHPQLREVVVSVYEPAPGDKRLVAYLVAEDGFMPSVSELREFIKGSMPEYMVPSAYVFLAALPITPNGKLNRKALPEPNDTSYAAHAYEEPQGETEQILARLWAELLNVERVGRQDNFFELGGHSLLVVMLIENMRRAGLHADVAALLTAPSLAEMAAAVGGGTKGIDVPPNRILPDCETITPKMLTLVSLEQADIDRIVASVPGGATNVQDIYPLAPLQEGILFHHLMESEGDTYLLSAQLTFDTRECLDSFLSALQAVIARQDILRTAMAWEGLPEPVQVVWREASLPVEEVAVDAWVGDVASQLAERFDSRHYRIDLRTAPLIRAFAAYDEAHGRWLLLLMIHHLLADHTTLEILLEEIKAHLLGQADRLPAPLPYRNFVAQARQGMKQEEHEAFFQQKLGDVDEPTAPFGLLDVRNDDSVINKARLRLQEDLARRIRDQAGILRVSTASVFHLAWAQVLARVSAREDVVFGTVLFGRMQSGERADRAMGLFMNTLPIRIHVNERGVADCVCQTHELLAGLLRHEHAQLALAQRCSAITAPAPLFTALLNYRHNRDTALIEQGEGALEREFAEFDEQERTNYPIVLNVDDLDEGFLLTAQTKQPVEPERMCSFMLTALENLIEALETAPDTASRAVDVLPADERRRVLEEWNDTTVAFPRDQCIHDLFEAQAARTPQAVAVAYKDSQLTYGELNAQANRLAHHLRELGVKPDARVALCVERGLNMVVGLLAILKAGGAYVPLDPAYPKERLAFMLEDSAPVAVLTQGRLESLFADGVKALPVIDLDADFDLWARKPETNPDHSNAELTAENLAYVIYTSGSTGQPKGVMVEHINVVNFLYSMSKTPGITRADSLLAVTTVSFDIAGLELFLPLINGAKIVLVSRVNAADSTFLQNTIEQSEITILQATPATWRLLLDGGWQGSSRLKALCGGEALATDLSTQLIESVGELWNLYGPTETTIWSTYQFVNAKRDELSPYESIGRPIANTQIYILDAQLQPVPQGVLGEIYIGGTGVTRGYLNRPELTAERFVPDPFAAKADARMYKTGDLARWLDDGCIEYQGRNDFQVKIRGFRIELGDIEATLRQHPELREVAVAVYEPIPGDKRLAAYVVVQNAPEPTLSELRDFLKPQLPEFMIPSAFVFLDELPLTPNGKLDRDALPMPDMNRQELDVDFIAPRSLVEQQLAEIWCDVLRINRAGIHDNFFELGGQSLLATQIIIRVGEQFSVDVSLSSLFERPTIAELAGLIENTRARVSNPHPILSQRRSAYKMSAS